MCQSNPVAQTLQQATGHRSAAQTLRPDQRIQLGVQALAGRQPTSQLADDARVSRKFVYQQAECAHAALDDAFAPVPRDDRVLVHLPVTTDWLRQVTLGLTLICHSSYRGVVEFCRDLLDVPISVGTVQYIHRAAVHGWSLRSEHPHRVDQSPTELLTRRPHPQSLELLGYQRFTC